MTKPTILITGATGKTGFFEMPKELSLQIDTKLDLSQANQKIKKL